jgi:hypothetical protein
VTKIFRVPDGLVGFAGDGSRALALLEWFRAGRKVADYPDFQKGDDAVGCLFVDLDGIPWGYHHTAYPERHEDRFDAIGSGRDYALAAMYLGHPAEKAVEVACALDNGCGNGIDVLELAVAGPGDKDCESTACSAPHSAEI